jgi:uncharacterized protein (TIGR02284 family)
MADHSERWLLNHLIEICRDEERALLFAADRVTGDSVKALFVELASERARFVQDLLPHAHRLGGAEAAGGTTRGALHRSWVAAKDALVGYADREMIAETEQGEERTLATFEQALDEMLPLTARDIVERQCAELRLSRDRVHSLLLH